MRTGNIFEDILIIVSDCEAIQTSNESEYTKEQAKITAYDEIMEMLRDMIKEAE